MSSASSFTLFDMNWYKSIQINISMVIGFPELGLYYFRNKKTSLVQKAHNRTSISVRTISHINNNRWIINCEGIIPFVEEHNPNP